MSAIAVIPARYNAHRLPGKPLLDINGQPLVYHVYKRLQSARLIERVIVATDDNRIIQAVESFHGTAVMTSKKHTCGTDRVAEIIRFLPYDIVINVQVDEPLVQPRAVDDLVAFLESEPKASMASLACPLQDLDEMDDPNIVKLVMDLDGRALYFSRSAIPFPRIDEHRDSCNPKEIVSYRNDLIRNYYKHIGVYGYRKEFLLQWMKWEASPLERLERLEQLRAIEHGIPIHILRTDNNHQGINTREDYERFQKLVAVQPKILDAG